eukprot:TRINITY_DN23560_c0_g1_i1.p1 TRINITY_DN23560_c0_g1~~TRINITY_DN23560_c0_g1_i1.p1  ORF type:complete len:1357 (-),score=248.40 TRINITY_DN23560_c0_g1_i1:122-4111(-)
MADDPGAWKLGADVMFGQSAVFSGQDNETGNQVRRGILSAFEEWNHQHPSPSLGLISYDDAYDPEHSERNTRRLISEDQVFALIGFVGTPTSLRVLPLVNETRIPFIGPFSGAKNLRRPFNRYVLNYRASYADEAAAMVRAAVEKYYSVKISVFYQNDGFGIAALEAVRSALRSRRMHIHSSGAYERSYENIEEGLEKMTALAEPDFVVLAGAHKSIAKFVKAAKQHWTHAKFCSFVSSEQLSEHLSPEDRNGFLVTQVVELPDTDLPLVRNYRAALNSTFPNATAGFTSLEGYIVGRLAAKVAHAVWHAQEDTSLSRISFLAMRESFLDYVYSSGIIHIGTSPDYRIGPYGYPLGTECYHTGNGCGCNQGMRRIFGSSLRADGSFREEPYLSMDFDSCGIQDQPVKIFFGQTVAASTFQGKELTQGNLAALQAANSEMILGDTELALRTYDDDLDEARAARNIKNLTDDDRVFAILSSGQPETVLAVVQQMSRNNVPLVGAPSGSGILRHSAPFLEQFINMRASLDDEADGMVSYFVTRVPRVQAVALVCQLPVGEESCAAVERALQIQGLEVVGRIIYVNLKAHANQSALEAAAQKFSAAAKSNAGSPELLIVAASASLAAEVIRSAQVLWPKCYCAAFSWVIAEELAGRLISDSGVGTGQVFVSQVVPNPYSNIEDSCSLVKRYWADLKALNSSAMPSFASLEGYMTAKLIVEVLIQLPSGLGPSTFVDRLYRSRLIYLEDQELGSFTKTDEMLSSCNQGMKQTYMTTLRSDGTWEYVFDGTWFTTSCGRPNYSCARGLFRPNSSDSCRSCGIGNRTDGVKCLACEPGKYGTATHTCLECHPGRYNSDLSQTMCQPCSSGKFSSKGSSLCTSCPAGRESNEDNTNCDECPKGTFAATGDESCKTCGTLLILIDNECHWFHLPAITLGLTVVACLAHTLRRRRVHAFQQKLAVQLQRLRERKAWGELWNLKYVAVKHLGTRADSFFEEVRQESVELGIGFGFVMETFMVKIHELVRAVEWRQGTNGPSVLESFIKDHGGSREDPPLQWIEAPVIAPPEDPNFIAISPLYAYGEQSPGCGMVCPRDGKENCSIVDAVYLQEDSGPADQFVSWVWAYPLSVMFGALMSWQRNKDAEWVKKQKLWWCYFCNNQFRLLLEKLTASTEDLVGIFGDNVSRVGKMWLVLDKMEDSQYVKRLWCIFEVFVACRRDIPCSILLPGDGVENGNTLTTIDELVGACKIRAEDAKASVQEDENGIKRIIEEGIGFSAVNDAVERQLCLVMLDAWRRRSAALTGDAIMDEEVCKESTQSGSSSIRSTTQNFDVCLSKKL